MSEHSSAACSPNDQPRVGRSAHRLILGETSLTRSASGMEVLINEPTKPFFQRMPKRVIGRLKLTFEQAPQVAVQLDRAGEHHWMGVAPSARLSVELDHPKLCFEGSAYHDSNWGSSPLEDTFESWSWSRAEIPQGALVLYDIKELNREPKKRALLFHHSGEVEPIGSLNPAELKRGLWGISRPTRVDSGSAPPQLYSSLIDSPFYTRDLISTSLMGHETIAVHESLNLKRFQRGWVRFLLPFRIRII